MFIRNVTLVGTAEEPGPDWANFLLGLLLEYSIPIAAILLLIFVTMIVICCLHKLVCSSKNITESTWTPDIDEWRDEEQKTEAPPEYEVTGEPVDRTDKPLLEDKINYTVATTQGAVPVNRHLKIIRPIKRNERKTIETLESLVAELKTENDEQKKDEMIGQMMSLLTTIRPSSEVYDSGFISPKTPKTEIPFWRSNIQNQQVETSVNSSEVTLPSAWRPREPMSSCTNTATSSEMSIQMETVPSHDSYLPYRNPLNWRTQYMKSSGLQRSQSQSSYRTSHLPYSRVCVTGSACQRSQSCNEADLNREKHNLMELEKVMKDMHGDISKSLQNSPTSARIRPIGQERDVDMDEILHHLYTNANLLSNMKSTSIN